MTTPTAAAPPPPNPPPASEPLLDLQRLMVAIRRGRRLWIQVALLGFIAGAVLAFLVPPKPTASVRLLVAHEQEGPDTGALLKTDIAIIQTTRIAGETLKKVGSTERPEDFLANYQAAAVTGSVLELTVSAGSDAEATTRAKALADVFIADHLARIKAGADAEAKALLDQQSRYQDELTKVEAEIAAAPARPTGEAATKLDGLYSRRSELGGQITDLGRRAEEASIGAPRVTAGTQIVDDPRAVTKSVATTAVTNAAIGLLLGLAAGITVAAVMSVVRDRPVLRREIANHLGASVIAQLPAQRKGPSRLWRRSRAVAERKRVAATIVRAIRDNTEPVSLLELGAPKATAALAIDMAEALAADGPVVLIDELPGAELAGIETADAITVKDSGDLPLPTWPGEWHIGVGSVAPGAAWTDVGQLGGETVLVVRAGHANILWLHTVARQLAELSVPVIGVVLVDPDPRDRTDGTLWDGLHTALRGRAGHASGNPSTNGAVNGNVVPRTGDQPTERRAADQPTERFTPVVPSAPANWEVT